MTVSLVSHIPDQFIVRGVINIVKCNCQFNNAQTGAEMPRIDR